MSMSDLWEKLSRSKKYREHFVAAQVKQAMPFQIRALLKERGWSQDELAQHAGLTQGAVSRAANPQYGNLSLNTLVRIAAGFDVAFVGRFVPFGELDRWINNLSEETKKAISFDEEARRKEQEQVLAEARERAFQTINESVLLTPQYPMPVTPKGQTKLDFGRFRRGAEVGDERSGRLVLIKTGGSKSFNPPKANPSPNAVFAQGA